MFSSNRGIRGFDSISENARMRRALKRIEMLDENTDESREESCPKN